jgi:hypothetical protein
MASTDLDKLIQQLTTAVNGITVKAEKQLVVKAINDLKRYLIDTSKASGWIPPKTSR